MTMIAPGREGFLTGAQVLAVLRKLRDAEAPVTLGVVAAGTLSLTEQGGAVTAWMNAEPAFRIDPAPCRGGWLTAPGPAHPFWGTQTTAQ
jgi:hypothetical protein